MYLVKKAMLFPETPIDKIAITNDDQIPFILLDSILQKKEEKHQQKIKLIDDVMAKIADSQGKKVSEHKIKQGEIKHRLENSICVSILNDSLEMRHGKIFKKQFMNDRIHELLVTNGDQITTSKEIVKHYNDVTVIDDALSDESTAKQVFPETYFKAKRKEMEFFNNMADFSEAVLQKEVQIDIVTESSVRDDLSNEISQVDKEKEKKSKQDAEKVKKAKDEI